MNALHISAVICAALVAGIFFAFSTFVMRALAKLEAREGIAAMQSVNVVVQNPWFFGVFFGAGILSIAGVLGALLAGDAGGRIAAFAGAALYLVGCIGVTAVKNVPLNDQLAKVEPTDEAAALFWDDYVTRWNRWNHVRTAACLLAAAAFSMALTTD